MATGISSRLSAWLAIAALGACTSAGNLPTETTAVTVAGNTLKPVSSVFNTAYTPPPSPSSDCRPGVDFGCDNSPLTAGWIVTTSLANACQQPSSRIGVFAQNDVTDDVQELAIWVQAHAAQLEAGDYAIALNTSAMRRAYLGYVRRGPNAVARIEAKEGGGTVTILSLANGRLALNYDAILQDGEHIAGSVVADGCAAFALHCPPEGCVPAGSVLAGSECAKDADCKSGLRCLNMAHDGLRCALPDAEGQACPCADANQVCSRCHEEGCLLPAHLTETCWPDYQLPCKSGVDCAKGHVCKPTGGMYGICGNK